MPTDTDRWEDVVALQEEVRIFPALKDALPEILAFVKDAAVRAGLPQQRVEHFEVTAEEVAANICTYAYPDGEGQVAVRVQHNQICVVAEFIDQGIHFDPLAMEGPDLPTTIREAKGGGMGIFLVRRFMDQTRYRRAGSRNILTLLVYRPG